LVEGHLDGGGVVIHPYVELVTFAKYSNFGLQKFRIDCTSICGDLRVNEDSVFTFPIPRYGDLLMDTYIVLDLPDIWSPLCNPCPETNNRWVGYEYKWIDDIGAQMIKSIEICCGSVQLQQYSGSYLSAMIDRDFTTEKKRLYDAMSGNTVDINDPGNAFGRENAYPSAYYTTNVDGAEPSIRGKKIYVPISSWFSLNTRCAFPLQTIRDQLHIKVTMRPVHELFLVRDVHDFANDHPFIQPDMTGEPFLMYHFLQTPPARVINKAAAYQDKRLTWNADVHLVATYGFLSVEEAAQFKKSKQQYLMKNVVEYAFNGIVGSKKVQLKNSKGLVANWMFYLRRSDAALRNQWSNYSNWPYKTLPSNVVWAPMEFDGPGSNHISATFSENTGLFISGDRSSANQKEILLRMGVQLDGEIREISLDAGVYDYVEKFTRSAGFAKKGLYCYNFCLSTDPHQYQPSGAINLSHYKRIELDLTTFQPELDRSPNLNPDYVSCSATGKPTTVSRKNNWELYESHYNLVLFEETY
jgi:Major capsid protein N-terminus